MKQQSSSKIGKDPEEIYRILQEDTGHKHVRVSVANLISDINGIVVAIVNKNSIERGSKNISCIGGAAILKNKKLARKLGGFDFEGNDSRFKLPKVVLPYFLEELANITDTNIENSPERELKEELSEETIPGIIEKPILSTSEVLRISSNLEFNGIILDTSLEQSGSRDLINVFVWRYFSIMGPKKVAIKLLRNSAIYPLSKRMIESGETIDGFKMSPNLRGASALVHKNNSYE